MPHWPMPGSERGSRPAEVGRETWQELLRQELAPKSAEHWLDLHVVECHYLVGKGFPVIGPGGKGIRALPFILALENTISAQRGSMRSLFGGIGRRRRDRLGHCPACLLALPAGFGTLFHLRFVMP